MDLWLYCFQTKPYPPYTPLWDFADASSFSVGTIEPVGCDGNLSDPGRERWWVAEAERQEWHFFQRRDLCRRPGLILDGLKREMFGGDEIPMGQWWAKYLDLGTLDSLIFDDLWWFQTVNWVNHPLWASKVPVICIPVFKDVQCMLSCTMLSRPGRVGAAFFLALKSWQVRARPVDFQGSGPWFSTGTLVSGFDHSSAQNSEWWLLRWRLCGDFARNLFGQADSPPKKTCDLRVIWAAEWPRLGIAHAVSAIEIWKPAICHC